MRDIDYDASRQRSLSVIVTYIVIQTGGLICNWNLRTYPVNELCEIIITVSLWIVANGYNIFRFTFHRGRQPRTNVRSIRMNNARLTCF